MKLCLGLFTGLFTILRHIFTENNNKTTCPVRLIGLAVCLLFFIGTINSWLSLPPESFMDKIDIWSTAALKIVGVAGTLIGGKSYIEGYNKDQQG